MMGWWIALIVDRVMLVSRILLCFSFFVMKIVVV